MAPSSGHILVPEAVKAFKYMVSKGAAYLRARLPQAGQTANSLEAIPVRIAKQPLRPVAALRQSRLQQQRNFSTSIRRIIGETLRPIRASRPVTGSAIRSAVTKANFTPFSSPLRPNLTGGTLPRSAGGYTLGGNGIRHFSSTPAAQAHVVQNVSAAVRAFCINGFKAQYDGQDARGANKYRAVTKAQEKVFKSMHEGKPYGKGTSLEFRIAPAITVLPTSEVEATLESEDIIKGLASDFSRSLSSLAMVHADLRKLATLGSLPISYPNPYTLSVRFAGCDATLVYALCDELGIQRGVVREDPEWNEAESDKEVEMALLFPWAPSQAPTEDFFVQTRRTKPRLDWQDMVSERSVESMHQSENEDFFILQPSVETWSNPWQSVNYTPSYDALRESDFESNEDLGYGVGLTRHDTARPIDSSAYEGMEGMLRFLEQCEPLRR